MKLKHKKTLKYKKTKKGGARSKLIQLIENKQIQEALDLIKSNPNDVGFIDNDNGETALIIACHLKMNEVALALIERGQSHLAQNNNDENNALIYACQNKMNEVALALIETGQSNPGQINSYGNTALMYVCLNNMNEVALALIATGQSKPEQINNDEENTALMYACQNSMNEVALALILTGQSNLEHVNYFEKNTALIYACENIMDDIALAFIATGHSNPGQININDETASIISLKNKMINVVFAISETQPNLPNISINIDVLKIHDIISLEDISIKNFISENPENNVVFIIDKAHCFSGYKTRMLENLNSYIKFECTKENGIWGIPNNLTIYCSLNKITNDVPIDYITYDDAIQICNPLSGNIFQLTRSSKKLISTVSAPPRLNPQGRCPIGKEGFVYSVEKVIPDISTSA